MPRYPDPHAVVRPTTAPPPFPAQLTTRTILARPDARTLYPIHNHIAFVNADGEGVTDVVAGHFHRVRGGQVLPDESDGHKHTLSGLPAGAGSPTPNRAG